MCEKEKGTRVAQETQQQGVNSRTQVCSHNQAELNFMDYNHGCRDDWWNCNRAGVTSLGLNQAQEAEEGLQALVPHTDAGALGLLII